MTRLLALCTLGFVLLLPLAGMASDDAEQASTAAGTGEDIRIAQQAATPYLGTAVGLHSNVLKADVTVPFAVSRYPHSTTPDDHAWVHIATGESYAVANQEFLYDFELRPGTRLRVIEVVDADHVRVEDADDRAYVAPSVVRTYTEQNRWRTLNGGGTEAIATRFYLPNGLRLTVPHHTLREGDVLRVSDVIEPVRARFLGGGFHAAEPGRRIYGAEAGQSNAPQAVRTWPERGTMPVDAFFIEGLGWSFVDMWADARGASSDQSHDLRGRFSFELTERDGVRRWRVAQAGAESAFARQPVSPLAR